MWLEITVPICLGGLLALVYMAMAARKKLHDRDLADEQKEQAERWATRRKENQAILDAMVALRQAVESMATDFKAIKPEVIQKAADGLEKVPYLVDGLQAMCQNSASQVDVLMKAVELLQASMSVPTRDVDEFAEETPGAKRAAEQQEINDLVAKGITRTEAVDRVRERRIYDRQWP
jgi:hypothetical protein